MEFANLEALQAFLSRWLEQHGHEVYCHVPVSSGEKVDILTQDYLIRCTHTLTEATLQESARDLQVQWGHFPDQQPIVAGLTPEQSWEAAYAVAEDLKGRGIEVWFIDQMPSFTGYYTQIAKQQMVPGEVTPTSPVPWGGCLLATGVATILGLSLWFAFTILERYQRQTVIAQDRQAWEQLHGAVEQWDVSGSQQALATLSTSGNPCVATFSNRFSEALEQRGPEGFREINPI